MNNSTVVINHVAGNVLRLSIPLTIKKTVLTDGVKTVLTEDFPPDTNYDVVIDLYDGLGKHNKYIANVIGNVASIVDNGKLRPSTYSIQINCVGTDGNPYRYKVSGILKVHDLTKDAGIEAGIEFDGESYTLEGVTFVSYYTDQKQSDWAENDNNEKSYIKNKPDLSVYQEKEEGKGLSSNDFSNADKQKLDELTNYDDTEVRNMIITTNSNFANYYTKYQTYSAEMIDQLLRTQREGRFVVASLLPVASRSTMFAIYLVPSASAQQNNIKDEYITISETSGSTTYYYWEKIGNTAIDLSSYPTTQEMNAAITSALNSYYTSTQVNSLLNDKQNVLVSGQNVKTINGQSILGEGNIVIEGGGVQQIQSDWEQEDTTAVDYIKHKPIIPDLSDFIQKSNTVGLVKNDGTIDTNTYLTQQDISGKQDKIDSSHKLSADLVDDTSATNKFVTASDKTTWNGKQEALVSGGNIKTINNESVLGSGNISAEKPVVIEAPVNASDATLPVTALSCEVGKYYRLDVAVETLAITLPAMTDLTTVRAVVIYLTGGTTPAVTISGTAPTGGTAPDVVYQDGYEIEAGGTYEINCLWNGLAWVVAGVKIDTSNS